MSVVEEVVPRPAGLRGLGARTNLRSAFGVLRNPLYRNGLALVLNSGTTSVLGILYWSLAARSATPAMVGLNAALVSALVACSNISQLGLGGGLASYLPTRGADAAQLVKRAYLTAALVSLTVGTAFAFVAGRFSPALRGLGAAPLAAFFVVSVAVWSLFGLQDNVLTGLRKAAWVPVENICYSLVKLVLVVALGGALGGYGIFVSWTVPAALALAPVSLIIFKRFMSTREVVPVSSGPAIPFARFVAGDSVGMVLSQISTTLLPVLVVAKAGASGGGKFYIPWMLAQSLDMLGVNIGMSLTVEGARARHSVRPMLRKVLIRVLIVVAVVGLVMGVGAPVLLRAFGTEYADASATLLRLLLLGSLFRAVNALVICASRAELAARRIVGLQALLTGIVPVCAWVFMGPLGAAGAAVAWLLGQGVTSVFALRSVGWLKVKGK